jgi:hypothetical protein
MQPDPNLTPAQPLTPPPTPPTAPLQAPQIIQPQAVVSPEPAPMPAPSVAVPPQAESPGTSELPSVAPTPTEQSTAVIAEPMVAPPTPGTTPTPAPVPTPANTVVQPNPATPPEMAAVVMSAASAPLTPAVTPMVNPIQSPAPSISAVNPPKKGKRLKIIGGIVAAVVILVVIGVVAIVSLGGEQQIIYSSADVSTVSTQSYSINRAKEWTDASSNKSILNYLKSSLGATSSLTDQKIYTYKYDFKTNKGQTLMLVGDTELGVTDAQLQQGLKSTAAKQQFESGFKNLANVLDTNSLCAAVSGKNQSIKYETSKFLVEVRSDVDCNYSAANASKFGAKGIHQSLFLGIKNGKTYLVSLIAAQSDWTKNGAFYQDKIFGSVQPK